MLQNEPIWVFTPTPPQLSFKNDCAKQLAAYRISDSLERGTTTLGITEVSFSSSSPEVLSKKHLFVAHLSMARIKTQLGSNLQRNKAPKGVSSQSRRQTGEQFESKVIRAIWEIWQSAQWTLSGDINSAS